VLLLGGTFDGLDGPLLLSASSVLILGFGLFQLYFLGMLLLDVLVFLEALVILAGLILARTSLRLEVYMVLADDELRLLADGLGLAARLLGMLGVLGVVGPMLGGALVGLQLVPERLFAQEFEEGMVVLTVLRLRPLLVLAGPEQRLDLPVALRVVFGGLDDDLPGERLGLAVESVPASVRMQFLLEFSVVGNAGSVDLVILSIICIEA
jgi:hypothetical protein